MNVTALIAEDEPLLRQQLREALQQHWPQLQIVAEAEDGVTAMAALLSHRPDIAFLDIRMPGSTGLEVARAASGRCHVVFLTAYDEYALAAFDAGAVDYLLKPLQHERLNLAIARLQQRIASPPANLQGLLNGLMPSSNEPLRWIHAASGMQMRIVAVDEVAGFVADAKYTRLLGVGFDAHIRKTITELAASLDPARFCQVSRSAVVNLGRVDRLERDGNGGMRLWLGETVLLVSRPYQTQFKQM